MYVCVYCGVAHRGGGGVTARLWLAERMLTVFRIHRHQ